jgi:hypothetical protein
MMWLTPLAGILLAAATVPPLVALYFLKLRRQPRGISSTLLWKRSLEDLRANAPFQRLRMNLLLLLQLLALGLLAVALAQPQVDTGLRRGGKTVLLIDNSASMNATDLSDDPEKPKSRLEFAKEDAIARVEKLFAGGIFSGGSGEVMVIAFADRADVRCPFSDSRSQVIDAIRSIAPTDGRTRIGEALQLARAYTSSVDPDKDPTAAIESAALVIFSDGRIEDIESQAKKTGESIVFNRVGSKDADNVAVVRIAAERSPNDPDRIQVFASLGNANAVEVRCDVELSVDTSAKSITPDPIVVPPARLIGTGGLAGKTPGSGSGAGAEEPEPTDKVGNEGPDGTAQPASETDTAALTKAIAAGERAVPGREQVVFLPFAQPRDAVIGVAQLRKDDLAIDDAAALVVPPARRLHVAYVGRHSPLLRILLKGMALESYVELTGEEFMQAAGKGETEQFDVVVLDGYTPAEGTKLPPGRYLSFAGTPVPELAPYAEHERVLFRMARQDHPVFRAVNANDLFVSKAQAISPPREAEVLMEGTEGPLMFSFDRAGVRVLHVAFDPHNSNWPFARSWVNFVPNALEWLGASGDALALAGLQPGSTASIRVPSVGRDFELAHPDGHVEPVVLRDPGMFSYGPLTRVGIYSLSWSEPGRSDRVIRRFAVNLLNPTESLIAPVDNLAFADAAVRESGVVGAGNARSALWPALLVLSLAVLLLEWWVYQRRTA